MSAPLTAHAAALARLDAVEQTLATATTSSEVVDIRNKAEALRQLARKQRRGLELQNRCAEIKLRAERRLGAMLAEMPKRHGARPADAGLHDGTPDLESLGIGKADSHRWQLIADIPAADFEAYVAETKALGDELTTTGTIRLAKAIRWRPLFSSQSMLWKTPPEIIGCTLRLLGDIDLDPCADDGKSNVPAKRCITKQQDGFRYSWQGRVFLNPPYGHRTTGLWIEKLLAEYRQGHTTEAVVLVPARADTRWWYLLRDLPICFVHGRLKFGDAVHPAPFPSAVAYLGGNATGFCEVFGDLGDIWVRWDGSDATVPNAIGQRMRDARTFVILEETTEGGDS